MAEKKIRKVRSAKLSFQNEFYSDLSMPSMLYAKVIRSPIKKGIITSVTHPDLPEGYYLFTARDVPGSNLIDTPLGKVPVFSEGNVSYLGEPIGLLAGPDEKTVNKLMDELDIGYDRNSIDYYFKEITIEGEDKLFSSEITSRKIQWGEESGKIDKIIEKAPFKVDETWTFAVSAYNTTEPNGALCSYADETLTVFTSAQWILQLRNVLGTALKIKNENIIIKKTKTMDHGTNSIWFNSIITCQAAVASYHTGKPVKLVYNREEQKLFMDTMQPISMHYRTSADEKGMLTAMDIDIKMDAGFINPFCQEIIDRLVIASTGVYRAKNIRINAAAIQSYNPPSSIEMGLIDQAAFFSLENQMTLMSQKCSMSPVELRLNNSIFNPELKKSAFPFLFDIEKGSEVFSALAAGEDYNRKYTTYNLNASAVYSEFAKGKLFTSQAPLRGIGFACAYEGSCFFGSEINGNNQYIELTFDENSILTIHTSPVSHSIEMIWSKLASEMLSIPQSSVKIDTSFPAEKEPPLPESVYSNISVMTELLKKGCEAINKKKDKEKLPFTIKKTITPSMKKLWNKEKFTGYPYHSTSFAAATVEIEMDIASYREVLRSIKIVISSGKVMHLQSAQNSIKLAVQKVLHTLVKEEPLDCPDIKIIFTNSDKSPKQLGELIKKIIPAAYTQALSQALNSTVKSLPLATDSLYEILAKKQEEDEKKSEELNNENTSDAE
ncbi:xanthine dehydrogenase family protein [Treponema sp.]|uniref:xanthine dehydrogenase family protein molybdopterin-binding subunit n=1 Tax=Treponema sp. TaxID=166 RepID=UPI0025D32329|nr:xanthine dehydrogenase family protein [Treponema sp.]MCR5217336.1 xanthine dehydrogenase family protein molybdopterin-binding subunit [Treponema sp.]